MPRRAPVRAILRLCVAGSIVLAATLCPIAVAVDLDALMEAPPLASTLLLGSASGLLALVGCVLRQCRAAHHAGSPRLLGKS
jgi:hypothetical protein